MKTMIRELREYAFAYSVIACGMAFVAVMCSCEVKECAALERLKAEYADYRKVSAAYIERLESDIEMYCPAYMDDVASETEAYIDFYYTFPQTWNNKK